MFQKKYESEEEAKKDQKKLTKMVDKLPKTKRTKKLKKEVKEMNFWDDDERKAQLLNIIEMVIGLIWVYISLKSAKPSG